jgi:preprotein translocase subunit SecG
MFAVLLTLHVIICLVLVVAILIQSGRGGGLVSAFGTSGGHAIFGGRGAATFLSKATTILGAGFMVTSLLLAVMSGAGVAGGGPKKGALEKEAERAASEVPQSLPPAGQSPFAPGGSETPMGGAGEPAAPEAVSPGAAPGGTPGAPSVPPSGGAMPAPGGAAAPSTPAPQAPGGGGAGTGQGP